MLLYRIDAVATCSHWGFGMAGGDAARQVHRGGAIICAALASGVLLGFFAGPANLDISFWLALALAGVLIQGAIILWLMQKDPREVAPRAGPHGSVGPHPYPFEHKSVIQIPVAGTFSVDYEEEDGKRTNRIIDAKSIDWHGGVICLNGFCHLLRAPRLFRADRIHKLTHRQTGEVVATNIVRWLQTWAEGQGPA